MSLLLKRQIERLETAIELSTDWLEIQYLMAELDQIKQLYEEPDAEAAWSLIFGIQPLVWPLRFVEHLDLETWANSGVGKAVE